MIVVTPETRTSLLVNRNYQAFAFCTARAAIRHLMTGRVKGIDSVGNTVSWSGADLELKGHSVLRWYNNEVSMYDDQPCLRSAPDSFTGIEKQWAIPTILVCTHSFGLHRRTSVNQSLRWIYNAHKGICQYCLTKIPYSKATKDHIYPKSKGGSNHDFNIVLACRDCNGAKDSNYPFYNVNGEEVKPLKANHYSMLARSVDVIRPEWKPFLHVD
jgi:hypothetical protein